MSIMVRPVPRISTVSSGRIEGRQASSGPTRIRPGDSGSATGAEGAALPVHSAAMSARSVRPEASRTVTPSASRSSPTAPSASMVRPPGKSRPAAARVSPI